MVKAALRAVEVAHRARHPAARYTGSRPLTLIVAFTVGLLLGLVLRG